MFELKNGILYQDGKPVIAVGQSYYPSFHEAKYPAPPSGDRIGLMKKDIAWMQEAGFQFLRVAAIGRVFLDEKDQVQVDTPFVDEMLREANAHGFAASVRLQGYVMNMRGHKGYLMLDENNRPMKLDWNVFMQSTLYHQGVLKDNAEASQALARHFSRIPGVISYQIYNEPRYPYNGIFDYHPAAIAAYQEWRRAKGLQPEEPPRRRPLSGESPEAWIQWRLFNTHAMSKFLNDTAAATHAAVPDKETYTCMTSAPVGNTVMAAGINYFDNAEGMECVGITSYTHQEAVDFYAAAYQYNMAACAAALEGKHAWTIEIDARTHMPARKLHEETYHLLSAGHKGIVYYEWRGDYPDEKTPLPDNCGFIFNDGSKTEHFDRSLEMIRFVNRYSTLLAAAESVRDEVGLLSSEHAAAYADAYMGDSGINVYIHQSLQSYRELRKAQINPSILCARHLMENRLGIKYLFIPCCRTWLSKKEIREIDAFVAAGGRAFSLCQNATFGAVTPYGWWPWEVEHLPEVSLEFRSNLEMEDVLDSCRITPLASFDSRHLKAGLLRGDGYTLAVINNTDPAHRKVEGARLTLNRPFSSARFVSPDMATDAVCRGTCVELPPIDEGGVLILRD